MGAASVWTLWILAVGYCQDVMLCHILELFVLLSISLLCSWGALGWHPPAWVPPFTQHIAKHRTWILVGALLMMQGKGLALLRPEAPAVATLGWSG
jgi:hypothetical protein